MTTSITDRVRRNTKQELNQRIERQTECNIEYYASHPDEINSRLQELDREWDIERTLEANAATASIAGLVLGTLVNRKWFFLPAIVGGFLLNHAVKGWCPPLPVFRRMGIRTQNEIERERYALKALRGDFNRIKQTEKDGENEATQVSHRIIQAVK